MNKLLIKYVCGSWRVFVEGNWRGAFTSRSMAERVLELMQQNLRHWDDFDNFRWVVQKLENMERVEKIKKRSVV